MCLCTSLEQTWELSTKTQISTDNFFCLHGKEIGGYKTTTHTHQKKNHRFYFRTKYPRNNWRLFSHGCGLFKSLNCEHGRCCYSCRQALGLNAVIPVHFCTMFQVRKSKCSHRSESERFIISVVQVENHGKKIDHSGCANKWEWVSVNGSRIGLVSPKRKNLVGHLKLYVWFKKHKKTKTAAQPQTATYFSV